MRKIKYICSVRIFYVHYNDALYILHKPACYHCGGCGRAGDIRLAGAGDLLARRAVASPALAAVLRPAMGLCGEGCALLARLRPLVRVAGGPGGKREVSAPHISLSMRVASTSLPARTGAAGTTGALCSVVAGPLSGWEFWGVGGMMLTTGGDTGGAVTGGAEAGSAAEFPGAARRSQVRFAAKIPRHRWTPLLRCRVGYQRGRMVSRPAQSLAAEQYVAALRAAAVPRLTAAHQATRRQFAVERTASARYPCAGREGAGAPLE